MKRDAKDEAQRGNVARILKGGMISRYNNLEQLCLSAMPLAKKRIELSQILCEQYTLAYSTATCEVCVTIGSEAITGYHFLLVAPDLKYVMCTRLLQEDTLYYTTKVATGLWPSLAAPSKWKANQHIADSRTLSY